MQLIRQGGGKPDHFKLVLSEIDRMEAIISEFLLLAKPEVQELRKVRLAELFEQVITLVNTQAIMNNIVIEDQIAGDLPEIECEENQIKQLFVNLFKNAIESMPDGGTVWIRAFAAKEREEVVIRVKDEGCGIPKERLQRLGEPFYSTKEKGTGLGLMLSYKIVKEHRGDIRIRSEVDRGTMVEVTLPVRQDG